MSLFVCVCVCRESGEGETEREILFIIWGQMGGEPESSQSLLLVCVCECVCVCVCVCARACVCVCVWKPVVRRALIEMSPSTLLSFTIINTTGGQSFTYTQDTHRVQVTERNQVNAGNQKIRKCTCVTWNTLVSLIWKIFNIKSIKKTLWNNSCEIICDCSD